MFSESGNAGNSGGNLLPGNASGNGLNGNSNTTDDNSFCNTSINKGGGP